MSEPNLFRFATSELSQDAFICWLLSWADPSRASTNVALHNTATLLLDRLLAIGKVNKPDAYRQVIVRKQVRHIDVLIEINGQFAIIIEDKTFTKHHSGQLERYLADVHTRFPKENVAAIYLKTGDQSSYAEVENVGYSCFRRSEFLEVLQQGRQLGVASDIFRDFHAYLESIEEAVSSFKTKSLDDWDWNCWTGFFIELQRQLDDGAWDYVANPSGGFMGFWWHWKNTKYLQLEEGKLCFKIEVEDKALQASSWEEWHNVLMTAPKSGDIAVQRPSRRRSGTWMTVAIAEGDYRKTNDQGVLDLDKTLAVLRRAEALLDSAVVVVQGQD